MVNGPEVQLIGTRDAVPPACNGSTLQPGASSDTKPWPYQWLDAMNEVKPNVVVLLAGRWEVVDREYQGSWTNILNPAYAAYVKQQLEQASQLVTATGARMVFLTAPCTNEGEQPDGAPWPEDNPARLAAFNRLIREVVRGASIDRHGRRPQRGGLPRGEVRHHGRRGRPPALRRCPLHKCRGHLAGAQADAADRGGRQGAGGERRSGGSLSRRVTPGSGSRSAAWCPSRVTAGSCSGSRRRRHTAP